MAHPLVDAICGLSNGPTSDRSKGTTERHTNRFVWKEPDDGKEEPALEENLHALTREAKTKLAEANMYQAQCLLQKGVKEYPCAESLHNLGVFYAFEGRYDRKETRYNAFFRAERLLKKALAKSFLPSAECALGYLYFSQRRYKKAVYRYKKAYCKNRDFSTAYNVAVSYYKMRKDPQAAIWAAKALEKGTEAEQAEATILKLFAMQDLKTCDDPQDRERLREIHDPFLREEKFVLTYLAGDREEARKQIGLLLDTYCLEPSVMAMVFDCLLSQNLTRDANAALECRIEQLRGYDYNVKSEIRQLQKAFLRESYRKRMIASYRYNHPAIFQERYLG